MHLPRASKACSCRRSHSSVGSINGSMVLQTQEVMVSRLLPCGKITPEVCAACWAEHTYQLGVVPDQNRDATTLKPSSLGNIYTLQDGLGCPQVFE